jgi:hypothetical protein
MIFCSFLEEYTVSSYDWKLGRASGFIAATNNPRYVVLGIGLKLNDETRCSRVTPAKGNACDCSSIEETVSVTGIMEIRVTHRQEGHPCLKFQYSFSIRN